jgi:C4-dicarboxylate-specific signal transduction histidine kinase
VAVVRTGIPRSVRLELDLAPAPAMIHARASEIHQVVLNLVKNAVEALEGKPDALVRIRTTVEEKNVVLAVEDNGPGIPEDVQKSLFTPFFTTKEKGTGLGLSISERIVRGHEGEMTLHSVVGEGTTFRIRLPALAAVVAT